MANFYKPRYKYILKAKSKIWPYKNSRLKGFYDIRGTITFRKGFWHRRHMKLKNLKWIQSRRFLLPKKKQRLRKKTKYSQMLIDLKRIRMFYGKFDSYKMKMLFFKSYRDVHFHRVQNFLYHLEQRADIVLFRLKFLPTIFACNHFIKYYGVLINNTKTQYPHTLIKVGEIISVPKNIWFLFYYMFERKIFSRLARTFSLYNRRKKLFKNLKLHFNIFKKRKRRRKKLFWLTKTKTSRKKKTNSWLFFKQRLALKLKKQLKFYQIFDYNKKLKKQLFKIKLKQLKLLKFLKKIKQKLLVIKNFIIILNNKYLQTIFLQIYYQFKKLEYQLLTTDVFNRKQKTKTFVLRKIVNSFLIKIINKNYKSLDLQTSRKFYKELLENKKFISTIIFQFKNKLNKKKSVLKNFNKNFNFNLLLNWKTKSSSLDNNLEDFLKQKLAIFLFHLFVMTKKQTKVSTELQKEIFSVFSRLTKNLPQRGAIKISSNKTDFYKKVLFQNIYNKKLKTSNALKKKKKKYSAQNMFQNFRHKKKDILLANLTKANELKYQNSIHDKICLKWLQTKEVNFFINLLLNSNTTKKMSKKEWLKQVFIILQNFSSKSVQKDILGKNKQNLNKDLYLFLLKKYKAKTLRDKNQNVFSSLSFSESLKWMSEKQDIRDIWQNLSENYEQNTWKKNINLKALTPAHITHSYYLEIVQNYLSLKKQVFYLNFTIQYLTINLLSKYKNIQISFYLNFLKKQFKKEKQYFLNYEYNSNKTLEENIVQNLKNFCLFVKNTDKKSKNILGENAENFYVYFLKWLHNNLTSFAMTEKEEKFHKITNMLFNHFVIYVFYEIQTKKIQQKKNILKLLMKHNLYISNILNKYNVKRYSRKFFFKKRFYEYLNTNKPITLTLGKWKKKKIKIRPSKSFNLPKLKRNILRKTWWSRFKQKQKGFIKENHWFIPHYMEFDFKTLRGGLIRTPSQNEVIYPFRLSIKRILNYYKDTGY